MIKDIQLKNKRNYIYILFLVTLAAFLVLTVLNTNPGHIYIGYSDEGRYNVLEENRIYANSSFERKVASNTDTLWGISMRLELSPQDVRNNSKRTSSEIVGIKKDIELPLCSEETENICVELLEDGVILCSWKISAQEIRPQTDTKFVLAEPLEGMDEKTLLVRVSTELEESRAFSVKNVQIIEKRIVAETIRILMLVVTLLMLGISVVLGQCREYHKVWIVLGGLLALLWIIAVPYGRVPDEESHFFRIFEIVEGHLVSDSRMGEQGEDLGRWMPDNLDLETKQHYATLRDVIDHRNLKLDRENEVWYSFPNMALYSPMSYLPQIIGVWLAEKFTDSVIVLVYAGRVAGLLTSLVFVYFALRYLTMKKECLFLIAMLPMMFQEMVSLSADSFINASSLLMMGFCISMIMREKEFISRREIAVLWVMAPIIGLCKVVYLPLCALYFIIPQTRFGSKKRKLLHSVGPTLLAVLLNLFWMCAGNIGESANSGQVEYILKNPFEFVKIVYRTLLTFGDEVLMELMGNNMGGLNIHVHELPLLLLVGFMVVIAVSVNKEERGFTNKQKAILTLVWMSVLAMTWGSMYLGYNEVGNNLITGFQGRYLIPILFFMLVSLENSRFEREGYVAGKYLYPLATGVNLYVLLVVFSEMLW